MPPGAGVGGEVRESGGPSIALDGATIGCVGDLYGGEHVVNGAVSAGSSLCTAQLRERASVEGWMVVVGCGVARSGALSPNPFSSIPLQ